MKQMGQLEAAVMHRLWDWDRPASVREVVDDLQRERKIAYTTVMTVADRLAKKGLTSRERDGRAWRYSASATREELTAQALRETLADWGGEGQESDAVLHFLQDMSAGDVDRIKAAIAKM